MENTNNPVNNELENEERDFVVFTDDDGNEFELDVIDYFFHDGQEYAVLIDLSEGCDCEHEHAQGEVCDCEDGCGERDVYIMKVVTGEETEEFMPVPDELFDTVAAIAQKRLEEAAEDEEESID